MIKSASLVKFCNPSIDLVQLTPDVFTYRPILEADTDIGFLPVVFTTVGICGTPFTVIVAVGAPAGASIATPPIPFPVSGTVNSYISLPSVSLLFVLETSFTVIVPQFSTIPPFKQTPTPFLAFILIDAPGLFISLESFPRYTPTVFV